MVDGGRFMRLWSGHVGKKMMHHKTDTSNGWMGGVQTAHTLQQKYVLIVFHVDFFPPFSAYVTLI